MLGHFHEKNREVQQMRDIFLHYLFFFFANFIIFRPEEGYGTVFINYRLFCWHKVSSFDIGLSNCTGQCLSIAISQGSELRLCSPI